MDKKDLENNKPQMSAMEAFRKTQKQIDEMNSAIGFPQGVLEAVDSLNVFKQSNAFESVQKIAEQFPHISTLDQLSTKPEIKNAIDNFNKSMAFHPSLFESLASNREIMNSLTDSFKAAQSYQEALPLKELYSQNLINQIDITNFTEISALKNLDFIKGLSSFQSIARMKNFPTEAIDVSEILESFSKLSDKDRKEIVELDEQLNDELSTVEDFNGLSEEKRSVLLQLYQNYYYPIVISSVLWLYVIFNDISAVSSINLDCLSESAKDILFYLYEEIMQPFMISYLATWVYSKIELKKSLKDANTKSEVKSVMKSSNILLNRSMFIGFRVNISNSLELRDQARLNSNVIEVLSIGTLLKVLDKSNRSWLFVEVEIDGELEQGWVLRRYTTYFK